MRKNRLFSIMAVMLVVAVFMIIFGEMLNGSKNQEIDDSSSTEELAVTEEDTENVHKHDPESYSYSEIQGYVAYLAASDEQKTKLNRLINPLNVSDSITVEYVKAFVEVLGVDTDVYTGVIKGKNDEDTVSRDEFEKIYGYVVDSEVITGIKRENIYVFGRAASEDSDTGDIDRIYDGTNYYSYDIDISTDYNDKIIDVYTKDGVIFKLNGLSDTGITLKNAWIIGVEDGKGSFLYQGVTKEYSAAETAPSTDSEELKEGFVADVSLSNLGIYSYTVKTGISTASVESIEDGIIYTTDDEEYKLAENYYIYDVHDQPFCEESLGILKGYETVELVTVNNLVEAVVVRSELISDTIRVLISNDDYSSYDMDSVTISGTAGFTIEYPNGVIEENVAGTTITVDSRLYDEGDKLIFTPENSNGRLQVLSITRDYGNPEYRGSLEVVILEDGVRLINELPLEEYLYSVVSSEMNSNSPLEALKAMAISARGYAYSRILDESYEAYDANIDDSNLCQMYNNIEENSDTIYAVKETYGIVPKHDGTVITPLYFSTSAGVTCTNSDIWGGNDYPYLKANIEDMEKSEVDLSNEDTFIEFIDNSLGYDTIEKDLPYYRWTIEFTEEEISEAINSTLDERSSMSTENIKVKVDASDSDEDEEEFSAQRISNIGTVKSIRVTERSSSGVVLTLEIEGTEATIQVTGQTNIRNLITPKDAEIVKQDESTITGWTSLPSPFYYVEKTEEGYVIHGGGFGHGAGMSQNGARLLADAGYDCEFILKHYYSDIELDTVDSIKK